jgi:FdhD protein
MSLATLENSASSRVTRGCWKGGTWCNGDRMVAEEVAVAFTYDGSAHAVMMATPQDLEDFAIGFSLSEGIVERPDQIDQIEINGDEGIELRMSLNEASRRALTLRRRYLAGPVGCGLCGVESLAEAMRTPRRVTVTTRVTTEMVLAAIRAMPARQIAASRDVRRARRCALAARHGARCAS